MKDYIKKKKKTNTVCHIIFTKQGLFCSVRQGMAILKFILSSPLKELKIAVLHFEI